MDNRIIAVITALFFSVGSFIWAAPSDAGTVNNNIHKKNGIEKHRKYDDGKKDFKHSYKKDRKDSKNFNGKHKKNQVPVW